MFVGKWIKVGLLLDKWQVVALIHGIFDSFDSKSVALMLFYTIRAPNCVEGVWSHA